MATKHATIQEKILASPGFTPQRAQFWYSSLSPRKSANPTGYSGAVFWWSSTLTELVAEGLLGENRLTLTVNEELREQLRLEGIGRPMSIGCVVSELLLNHKLVQLGSYLGRSAQNERSWSSLLVAPLLWSFSRIKANLYSVDSEGGLDQALWDSTQGVYVINDLVQRFAGSVIPRLNDRHADPLSRLYSPESLRQTINELLPSTSKLSMHDCAILTQYWASQNICLAEEKVIKFSSPHSIINKSRITDSDRSIVGLRNTLRNLNVYIDNIQLRIQDEKSKAIAYLQRKQKDLVKSHLMSKKRLEVLLESRVSARDRLDEVLMGIERATGDEETMAALTLGSKTLRTLISSPTLSLSHVEETSAALSDALDDANEINQAISEVNTLSSAQEDEIDDEFAALLAQSERTEEKKKKITRAEGTAEHTIGQREQSKEKEDFNMLAKRIESLNIRPVLAAKDLTKDSEPEPAVKEGDFLKKVPIME